MFKGKNRNINLKKGSVQHIWRGSKPVLHFIFIKNKNALLSNVQKPPSLCIRLYEILNHEKDHGLLEYVHIKVSKSGGILHSAEWVLELLQCVTAGRGCRQQPAGMLLPNHCINCWSLSFFLQVQGLKCLLLCFSELDRNCVQLLFPTGWTGGDTLCRGSARHISTAQPPVTYHALGISAQGERFPCFWWIPHWSAFMVYFLFNKQTKSMRKRPSGVRFSRIIMCARWAHGEL